MKKLLLALCALSACTFARPADVSSGDITIKSGDGQTGVVAKPLAEPFVVAVTDPDGLPISNFTVDFTVLEGAGVISEPSVRTDAQGNVRTTLTLGMIVGDNVVGVAGEGIIGEVVFTASSIADEFDHVAVGSGDGASATVATAIAAPLVARTVDQFGNSVPSIPVEFAVTAGGGTLSITEATSDANAEAATVLTVGTTAGDNVVEARAGGTTAAFTVTGTADVATSFALAGGNGQVATALVPSAPLEVIVRDRFGNPVPGFSVDFVRTVGAGTLSGATATSGANGRAGVTLTPSRYAENNTVEARAPALTGGPVVFTATTGTFRPEVSFAMPAIVGQQVDLGDLNADGKLDLIARTGTGGASIRLNTTTAGATTPTFADVVDVPSPTSDSCTSQTPIFIGDVDADGKPDIVSLGCNLIVYLNTTAAMATTPTFAAGQRPSGLGPVPNPFGGIADFDADDRTDLVGSSTSRPTILRNTSTTPTLVFTAKTIDENLFSIPGTPVVSDLNGDGKPDVVVAGTSTTTIFRNTTAAPGVPTFTTASISVSARNTAGIADLDGDAKPDIVLPSSNQILVLRNTTPAATDAPTFATAVPFPISTVADAVTVADFNGDLKPDVVVFNVSNRAEVVLSSSTTTPSFIPTFVLTNPAMSSIAAGDLNGDGKADLVFVRSSTSVEIVLAQ